MNLYANQTNVSSSEKKTISRSWMTLRDTGETAEIGNRGHRGDRGDRETRRQGDSKIKLKNFIRL